MNPGESTEDEYPEELIEIAALRHDDDPAAGRACTSCGYRDPVVCAMTCPMCDTRHPGVGIRQE
jgi:hypothetical protein